ncbi:ParA family protein [Pelagibius litoralis]|uniref:ParA family protein n=1 Tax=Pelagibius litoralis TaxID=374515 RepID=A0A967F0J3_9PROT|nr:ParA family partition ATPase [Pelagibius litoralis]NIA70774.1 ParA family protein [Pelagibius litoralis]
MAAKILTVAQQKGGAGKTTLAVNLAVAYLQAKKRVAVADIDPQRSFTMWHALRQELQGEDSGPTVSTVAGWKLAVEIDRLKRDHDVVIIDSPPHAETDSKIAVRQAELVIVPVQPSPMDVWATEAILDLALQEKVPALLVLNRVPPRANLTEEMMFEIRDYGAKIARSQIGNRVGFAGAMLKGLGVTEFQNRGRAAQEIRALSKEVLRLTG